MSAKSSGLLNFRPFFVLKVPQKDITTGKCINVQISSECLFLVLYRGMKDSDARFERISSCLPIIYGGARVSQLRVQSVEMSMTCFSLRHVPSNPTMATSSFYLMIGGGKSSSSI